MCGVKAMEPGAIFVLKIIYQGPRLKISKKFQDIYRMRELSGGFKFGPISFTSVMSRILVIISKKNSFRLSVLKVLGAIHKGRLARIGIFIPPPPLPLVSGLNNRISLKITIGVQIFRVFLGNPSSPG